MILSVSNAIIRACGEQIQRTQMHGEFTCLWCMYVVSCISFVSDILLLARTT